MANKKGSDNIVWLNTGPAGNFECVNVYGDRDGRLFVGTAPGASGALTIGVVDTNNQTQAVKQVPINGQTGAAGIIAAGLTLHNTSNDLMIAAATAGVSNQSVSRTLLAQQGIFDGTFVQRTLSLRAASGTAYDMLTNGIAGAGLLGIHRGTRLVLPAAVDIENNLAVSQRATTFTAYATGDNAVVSVTQAGSAGAAHFITSIQAGFIPVATKYLTIRDGTTVIAQIPVVSAAHIVYSTPIKITTGNAVSIEIEPSGAGGTKGFLFVTGYTRQE